MKKRISASWVCPTLILAIVLSLVDAPGVPESRGEETARQGSTCLASDDLYFAEQVWPLVGEQECLKCHKVGGDAEESQFLLVDPRRVPADEKGRVLRANCEAFSRMARLQSAGKSRLLQKVVGELDHGGQEVVARDSTAYRILAEFVRRLDDVKSPSSGPSLTADDSSPFFGGVVMLDDRRLLRRATLSLAGRLPRESELAAVNAGGLNAIPNLLENVMTEEAFYDRLREGFNDIFLITGYDGNGEEALSYDHFSQTRLWYQKYDLSHIPDEGERRRAGYKLANDYRDAMRGEPLKLIEYIVRNDRPFSEIVTADYIMVTPYTARGYGVYDELIDSFQNPDDPFEYVPVKLKSLVSRDGRADQESRTGYYPHAGLLSNFQYLKRYPTTETNRNRLRARMYYQHFLGVDVLELAARVSDAAAVTAKFEIPTMQASECVVCHKTLDPLAGLFQDYWKFEGVYGPRKGGWFQDMFPAGFEGEDLPADERWRALQWLGERTAQDPRFATTMVEHVYYILTGRKVLLPPNDLDSPTFQARYRAYREQRRVVETIAQRFSQADFRLKTVFIDWIVSDFYRADGLSTAVGDPQRLAELDDVGLVRLLSPEQVERKIAAIFGRPWGRLKEQTAMLYGGIDAKEVTERASDPSGAMGAIQRILSNDVACRETALDFTRHPSERQLFPFVEPDVIPGRSAEDDARIRRTLVHLHQRVLGRKDAVDSEEIDHSFRLFAGIVSDAAEQQRLDAREIYHCRNALPTPVPDPEYTVRAWRAVVTYLLRRHEFLYE